MFTSSETALLFPGEMLSRLCCDYGTGSAGITLFLNQQLGRQKSNYILDDFLRRLFEYTQQVDTRANTSPLTTPLSISAASSN